MPQSDSKPIETPIAQPGDYRAWLVSPGGEIAFGLRLERDGDEHALKGWITNGPEREPLGNIQESYGTLTITLDPYDSKLQAKISSDGKRIEGEWVRYRGKGKASRLPFHAVLDGGPRYTASPLSEAARASLKPRYKVQFAQDKHHAVGLFEQAPDSNKVYGTFLTTLGDYRYLEGILDGPNLTLSCFDGAHAFLFRAKLQADGSLQGDFWSRDSWHETWSAQPDDKAELPDPFGLTRFVGGMPFDALEFPDLTGKLRKLSDPAFDGKARLIVLFGSWCPNCNDQTDYMVELHERYQSKGLSILGLAFEFGDSFERNARVVRQYAEHHKAKFPFLIAGPHDKAQAAKAFPVLDKVLAYPTTLFVSATGEVRAVYTGFSGPATGPYHQKLREAFEGHIDALLE